MHNTVDLDIDACEGPANGKMKMCHERSTAGEAYSQVELVTRER